MTGVGPASPGWKPGIIAVIRHLHKFNNDIVVK